MILKAHILTGSDVTSKVGTKTAALKAQPERYLQDFGENTFVTDLVQAEKYLVNVVHAKSTCATFDELRYNIYTSKNKTDIDWITTYFFRNPRPPLVLSLFCTSLCHTSGFGNK